MSRRHCAYGQARRRARAEAGHGGVAAGGQYRPPQVAAMAAVATPARPVATATVAMATDTVATATATAVAVNDTAATANAVKASPGAATGATRWWVLDPEDDAACVRGLLECHDLDDGRVVCHPRPGAGWAVLVEDLLRALGKHPHALARERCTRDGPRLLGVWLRAERVRHLVVLRAHLLGAAVLAQLVDVAPAGCTVWMVWHHHDPAPTPHPSIDWVRALAALRADEATRSPSAPGDAYAATFTAARAEARAWQGEPHRLGWQVPYWEHAWPGCARGALLQRLTIDAADPADLHVRLHAAHDGFAAEAKTLTVPDLDPEQLRLLGPRLGPPVIARLRRLVCPRTAAAVLLGLLTDAEAPFLDGLRVRGCDTERITVLAGHYRVPERARFLLTAVLHTHHDPEPAQALLAAPDTGLISPQRLSHLVRRGAALAEITPPPAARPLYGINPATPFAGPIATAIAITTRDAYAVSS